LTNTAPDQRQQQWADAYRAKYGLSYHIPFAWQAEQLVGLKGKRILEVGGALPAEFVLEGIGAAAWLALEDIAYYEDAGGLPSALLDAPELAALTGARGYQLARGRIEELPAILHGQFDAIFSIAAFEHLNRFPRALHAMHAALRPGGKLFSLFAPVWSAHDGHHLQGVTDKSGRTFTYHNSSIPPWGHLLMRPPQLYQHLLGVTDAEAAAEIVYMVYHSPSINRLFTEDYADYVQASPFKVLHMEGVFPVDLPAETAAALTALYPGRRHFNNNGLLLVLER
jgi:SAM-dependent methyltransferase